MENNRMLSIFYIETYLDEWIPGQWDIDLAYIMYK